VVLHYIHLGLFSCGVRRFAGRNGHKMGNTEAALQKNACGLIVGHLPPKGFNLRAKEQGFLLFFIKLRKNHFTHSIP